MIKNLKMLREKKKVSQQRLAEEVGVSQQSINKYENHNIEPDIHTLIAIAEYFQTSVDFLIGHSEIDRIVEEVTPYDLNEEEIELVEKYRELPEKGREIVDLVLNNFGR